MKYKRKTLEEKILKIVRNQINGFDYLVLFNNECIQSRNIVNTLSKYGIATQPDERIAKGKMTFISRKKLENFCTPRRKVFLKK
jgi:hypothetical protein